MVQVKTPSSIRPSVSTSNGASAAALHSSGSVTDHTTQQRARQFLQRVTSRLETATQPATIKNILRHYRLLGLISHDAELQGFLNKAQDTPQSLTALMQTVQASLLNNPPICRFLAGIEERRLISDVELDNMSAKLNVQLNLIYVFEAFAIRLANGDKHFPQAMFQYLQTIKQTRLPGNPLWNLIFGKFRRHNSVFTRLKMSSIDLTFAAYAFNRSLAAKETPVHELRAKAEQFIHANGLALWNQNVWPLPVGKVMHAYRKGLGINIAEAVWQESNDNEASCKNAHAGSALIYQLEQKRVSDKIVHQGLVLPQHAQVVGGQYQPLNDLKVNPAQKRIRAVDTDQAWVNLYNTWNLFFVIKNIDSNFLLTKLLVPSVMDARESAYVEMRVLMLCFMASLFFYNDELPALSKPTTLRNKDQLFDLWSDYNRQYAAETSSPEDRVAAIQPERIYDDIFGKHHTIAFALHLVRLVTSFGKPNFRLTSDLSRQKTSSYASKRMLLAGLAGLMLCVSAALVVRNTELFTTKLGV